MKLKITFFLSLTFYLSVLPAKAWIYPEHRYILQLAIQRLSPADRAVFDKLWADARVGYEDRLSVAAIDPTLGTKPKQLDYASWAGIAGDHSCSPQEMIYTVLKTKWILKVAGIAEQLQIDIAKSKTPSKHVNALRNSDIRLQRADAEYASRAGSNNVHFLLSRQQADWDTKAYVTACLSSKSEINALSAYSWFHQQAISKAMKYAQGGLANEEKSAVILAALADEAFALHFLEDVYAAGHVAGTWGATSVRKGTHDYYNEKGLEITTWDNKRRVVRGDAYMAPPDADFTAIAVRLSLEQLIQTSEGHSPFSQLTDTPSLLNQPDTFNVCKNNFMVPYKFDTVLRQVLMKTPVPGLATGEGEMPRFRSELGMFVGLSTGVHGSAISGGFGSDQTNPGGVGGLEANIRIGLGLDGVLNQAGDGLVFFQAGIKQDASSTNRATSSDANIPAGAITADIPARTAYSFRLRLPFWLIPGDLILAAPILLLVSPRHLSKMAVTAGNGGVIPWQSGIATPIGRFQFVLGREVGVSIYGSGTPRQDAMLIQNSANQLLMVQYSSTKFDFPILEYKPLKTFSQNQSSSILIQLSTGFDIPNSPTVLLPVSEPAPQLKTVWFISTRILFDWRRYF